MKRSRRLWLLLAIFAALAAVASVRLVRWLRVEHHLRTAQQALDAEHLDEAGRHLDVCLELAPDSDRAHLLAARAARRSELFDLAEEHLRACEAGPEVWQSVRRERAMLAAQRDGLGRQTEAFLRQSLQEAPEEADFILEALAQGYVRTYALNQARACLDEWLQHRPGSVAARLKRAWVFERLEKVTEAEADYRELLNHHPDHAVAQERLAYLLLNSKHPADALPYYRRLFERRPQDTEARVGLARALVAAGEVEEARGHLDALLAKTPVPPEALLERGKLALDEGKPAQAEPWLREAAQRMPHDHAAQYQLALCLRKAGKASEASTVEARAKALADDLAAMNELTTALESRPDDPALRCRIAQIFLRRGEEREGVFWLESILRRWPDYAPAQEALAAHRASRAKP